jgi:endonuclease YncB( thermonuclease family)
MRRPLPILIFSLLPALAPAQALGGDAFPGPVMARVVAVHDGDTFAAEAEVWPGHSVAVNIRIRGIDAPEKRGRCPQEREASQRATSALAELLSSGKVRVTNIAGAKYYGRVLADVATQDGVQVAEALLAAALVRPYSGGKRLGWC